MKKGFTLVELLAVIAVLAVLLILTIPNIVRVFGDGEKKIFVNNALEVTDEAAKDYLIDDIKGTIVGDVITSFDENSKVELDGVEMDYYIEIEEDGTMNNIIMSDGKYCIESTTGKDGIREDKVTEGECDTITFMKEGNKKVTYFAHTSYVESGDDEIPLVVSNKSNSNIIVNVSFGAVTLSENLTVNVGEVKMIYVKLGSLYNSMKKDTLYKLQVNTISPVSLKNTDVLSVIKGKPDISIESITSSKGSHNFAYNNGLLMIENPVNNDKYTIKIKNNSQATLKFANINGNDVIVENEVLTLKNGSDTAVIHTPSINLSNGLYLSGGEEMTFDITWTVNRTFTKSFYQIFDFEFKTHFNPGIINDRTITIASSGNATSSTYGDFVRSNEQNVNVDTASQTCTYQECYSDNGGYYTYGSNGELLLDKDNAIGILNIDQSMSVDDEYSIYTTIKGDTNQQGSYSGYFAATFIAISEANTKYLNWAGFYFNYMNVHSYYNGSARANKNDTTVTGYSSFYIGDRSNKVTNIQITAKRGGKTRVYINGELRKEFNSGSTKVQYKFASIGDLRPRRSLKFIGTMYDFAIYNKELSAAEVAHNWNHAKNTHNITE